MMTLYHYTCSHRAKYIRRRGLLVPHRQMFGAAVVWLTDLDVPDRDGLGLTSTVLQCDRTEHRFTVDGSTAEWWPRWAHRIDRQYRDLLEAGRLPAHWWISTEPLEVAL